MSTFLYDIQAVVRDYLRTDEYFRDVEILLEDADDPDEDGITEDIGKFVEYAMMNDSVGKKKGLVILISVNSAACPAPNVPDVHFMPAQIVFDVFENRNVNRAAGGTGKKGLIVAETLLAVMAQFQDTEFPTHFWHDRDAIERIDLPEWGLIVRRCRMNTHGGSEDNTTETVETPVWSWDGLNLSLTCATPHARIFWALDARPYFGGVGNAANVGTEYELPFEPAAGPHKWYARAYKTGMRASQLAIYDTTESGFIVTPRSGEYVTTPGGENLTPL